MILKETSTFGVRYIEYNRSAMNRKFTEINTEYGLISIKLGYYKNKLIKYSPEYEDCKKIAEFIYSFFFSTVYLAASYFFFFSAKITLSILGISNFL